jgi:hypothetical protein
VRDAQVIGREVFYADMSAGWRERGAKQDYGGDIDADVAQEGRLFYI